MFGQGDFAAVGYGRQYAAHTATTLAAAIIMGALFYGLRIVLYQSLSLESYGLFYAVFSFGIAIQAASTFGFDPGLAPLVTRMNEGGDVSGVKQLAIAALVRQLSFALAATLVVAGFARPLATMFFDDESAAELFVPILLYMVLMVVFRTAHTVLLGLHAVQARNVIDIVRVSVAFGAAVWLLHAGWGVRAAPWAYAASAAAAIAGQAITFGVQGIAVVRAPFAWRLDLARNAFQSGKYLSIAFVGLLLFSQTDTLMLTVLEPNFAVAVGTYQVAVPTIMIAYSLLAAVAVSFLPMVTTLDVRGERHLLAGGLDRMYSAAFAVFLPASVAAAGFGDVLMAMLFRRDTYDASAAFAILSTGCIFYFICYLNLQVLAGLGFVRRAGAAIAVALAANLILNAILIPTLGIRGAAFATVCSFAIGSSLTGMVIVRAFQQPFRIHGAMASTLVSLGVVFAVLWIRTWPFFSEHPYLVAPIAGAILWCGAVALLELSGFVRLRELASVILSPKLSASDSATTA